MTHKRHTALASMAVQLTRSAAPHRIAKLGRLQRLQLLRQFEQAQANGTPMDAEVLRWLASAVRQLLEHGGRLDEHLGIASARQGKHQAPHKLVALQERDAAIAAIFAAAPGALVRHKTEATVRIIHGLTATPAGPAVEALETLNRMRGKVGMPESARQIVRIVHTQAIGRLRD